MHRPTSDSPSGPTEAPLPADAEGRGPGRRLVNVALRTSLLYAGVAALWILLSDRILVALVSDVELIGRIAMVKGWAFVAVTALLLYGTLRSQLGHWERAVAARAEAEAAQRQAERRYRSIFENASEGIYQTTPDGRFLDINEALARILGYASAAELIRERTDIARQGYVRTEDREAFRRRIEAEGLVVGFEYEAWRKDGTTVWLSESARVVRGPDGAVQHYEGFIEDISARKHAEAERERLQEQLLQAQKMESVGRLAGGVAHDFNNMLTAIQGNLALALQQLPADHPAREHLAICRDCTQRSADLTRQLLAFARKQTIQPQVLDLNAKVAGALKMLGRLIGEEIVLDWRPGAHLWPVEIDPTQIDQILANLCVNARDAINGQGRVTIETANASFDAAYCQQHADHRPGDWVRLTMSDTGCGMAPDTLAHIFEPFFTTKGPGHGTGLGLATVYGAVQQNHGFILVRSAPGQGSRFTLFLPRSARTLAAVAPQTPVTAAPPAEAAAAVAEGAGSGRITILIIEDEPTILQIARRTLERRGYAVLTANCPAEALRLVETEAQPIDLLITDVILPEMDGREVARRLQQAQPQLRCLFMSGYADNILAPHSVLDGSVHFLSKPFTIEELTEKVKQVLADRW